METIGKTPLTMGQYSRLLGACRVPHEGRDLFKTAGKGKSNSVTVIHNGQVSSSFIIILHTSFLSAY